MHDYWVAAEKIRNGNRQRIWDVDYTAHPLLDPDFPVRPSRLRDLTRLIYQRIRRSDEAYRQELARLFHPRGSQAAKTESLATLRRRARMYLQEADTYLAATIDLLPSAGRPAVLPLPEITDCDDVRDLIHLAFVGSGERVRYEARRKLHLAQCLLQIDHSRLIQEGPRHLALFEGLLQEGLWRYQKQQHNLSVGYRISPDGHSIQYTSRPETQDQTWHFQSRFVEKKLAGRKIALDILYYNCRFKRSVTPITFEIVDGQHRVLEEIRWSDMRQASSGSILSKMIRKGINNPNEIGDLIGAMFIVNDNDALDDLLILLDSCIGAPFGWRNVTDTLVERDEKAIGAALNDYSSSDFKVFKGDVDLLAQGVQSPDRPYRFPVEIQIFTLESYLRTVCGSHEASHLALKLRQFLFGLAPRIFPRSIYGEHWLQL